MSPCPCAAVVHGVVGPTANHSAVFPFAVLTSMPYREISWIFSASFLVEGLNPRRTRELSLHYLQGKMLWAEMLTLHGDERKRRRVQLEPAAWS